MTLANPLVQGVCFHIIGVGISFASCVHHNQYVKAQNKLFKFWSELRGHLVLLLEMIHINGVCS